jgi:hypothetical protein
MPNTHEYTIFDRAKVDHAFALKWPAFEKKHWGMSSWNTATAFLTEWALGCELDEAERIVATKTVRATLRDSDDAFFMLWGLLDVASLDLVCGGAEIGKGDYTYAAEIVGCAVGAHERGEITLPALAAVYHLHASYIGPLTGAAPAVIKAVMKRVPAPMFPDIPNLAPYTGDALGVVQTRLFFDFLRRAWRGRWPLADDARTIRDVEVAADLFESISGRRFAQPCIYRWYEC